MIEPFLRITPLGGLGEIGLNCQVWETSKGSILMDCGLMFPDDNQRGVDVVIPNFDVLKKDTLQGILLTHGHEDHIGALPWLVKHVKGIKIYGSRYTLGLVEHKLTERNLIQYVKLVPINPYDTILLGDLSIQAIPVCHSIPEGYSFFIQSPIGKIIHTGDFKLDTVSITGATNFCRDIENFAGDEGVRLLLSDSTNVETQGHSVSEAKVKSDMDRLFGEIDGRIIIALFASHIQRISSILELAKKHHKSIIVSGRSLSTNIDIAIKLGLIKSSNVYIDGEEPRIARERTIVLATGTQGETLSALTRISKGEHRTLALHPGDTVIMSSRVIPGNARAVSKVINQMYKQGANVYTNSNYAIHATGHACREELETVLMTAKPQSFIPLHGEYRHLVQHVCLAKELGVPKCMIVEDGQPVYITKNDMILEKNIAVESVLIDGKGVGDVGRSVLKDRRILSNEGIVIVSLILSQETGDILVGPNISSRGFIFEQQYSYFLQEAECLVIDEIENTSTKNRELLKERIRIALRRFFKDIIARDPIIESVITYI